MKETNRKIEEYRFGINENNQIFIEIYNTKEIKIIFDDENETNIMNKILEQLSKYYINDILY